MSQNGSDTMEIGAQLGKEFLDCFRGKTGRVTTQAFLLGATGFEDILFGAPVVLDDEDVQQEIVLAHLMGEGDKVILLETTLAQKNGEGIETFTERVSAQYPSYF